jgi:hypothetical protein
VPEIVKMTRFIAEIQILTFALQSHTELLVLKYMTISYKCVILKRKQVYNSPFDDFEALYSK